MQQRHANDEEAELRRQKAKEEEKRHRLERQREREQKEKERAERRAELARKTEDERAARESYRAAQNAFSGKSSYFAVGADKDKIVDPRQVNETAKFWAVDKSFAEQGIIYEIETDTQGIASVCTRTSAGAPQEVDAQEFASRLDEGIWAISNGEDVCSPRLPFSDGTNASNCSAMNGIFHPANRAMRLSNEWRLRQQKGLCYNAWQKEVLDEHSD